MPSPDWVFPALSLVRLIARCGVRNPSPLLLNWQPKNLCGSKDDEATVWWYVGRVSASTTGNFSCVLSGDYVPGLSGSEEWYAVVALQPELLSDLGCLAKISVNIASRFRF